MQIPRGTPVGKPGDSDSFLTFHAGDYDWCSDQGAVLTFKIYIPTPRVGNRGDSDKGACEGGGFETRNVKMSESSGSAHGGGTLGIHMDRCIISH